MNDIVKQIILPGIISIIGLYLFGYKNRLAYGGFNYIYYLFPILILYYFIPSNMLMPIFGDQNTKIWLLLILLVIANLHFISFYKGGDYPSSIITVNAIAGLFITLVYYLINRDHPDIILKSLGLNLGLVATNSFNFIY